MKLTAQNALAEYPKYRDKMPSFLNEKFDNESFSKMFKFYGKSEKITNLIDMWLNAVNDELSKLKDEEDDPKPQPKVEPKPKPAPKEEKPKKTAKQKKPKYNEGDYVMLNDHYLPEVKGEICKIIILFTEHTDEDAHFDEYGYAYQVDSKKAEGIIYIHDDDIKKKVNKSEIEDNATLVKTISKEVELFKSYANLNGKKVTYKQLFSLHTKLGKAIITGALDSATYQELLQAMHAKLGKAISSMKKNESVNITVENAEKYKEIGASEKLFVGVTLIKRYISLANMLNLDANKKETRRKNLLKAVNKALDDKNVEKQYIDYVKTIKKNLEDKNIDPITIDLSLSGICGLAGEICDEILCGCNGCNGLGSIVSATELAAMNFDTVKIPAEYKKMIGNASRNGSIMLYGMAGGGKTSFSINFAKKCAELGQKVLIISKEEGINQTMQEKLARFNAVNPNIFITDNIPTNTKNYDVVIFDSVQSLGLEPSDLEKHQKNLDALRIYIFQVTKDGKFRGANEFEHLVDCVLKAENGVITSSGCKNRFGGNGSVRVF